jgi:hypothetical protein
MNEERMESKETMEILAYLEVAWAREFLKNEHTDLNKMTKWKKTEELRSETMEEEYGMEEGGRTTWEMTLDVNFGTEYGETGVL